MISNSVLAAYLGPFDAAAATPVYLDFPPLPPAEIEAAARAAARDLGRVLNGPYSRGPADAQVGDRAFAWSLAGHPTRMVKVLATSERSTRKTWARAQTIANKLDPPDNLRVPRVHRRGNSPVPWCVEDEAIGAVASTASLSDALALEIVLAVQQTGLRGGPRLERWDVRTYSQQIAEPLRQLTRWRVITPDAGQQALSLARSHERRARTFAPVLVHNDLAISHIYLGDGVPWVIDWESPHYDRLLMLDIAHLMVNHGHLDPQWARGLAQLALDCFGRRLDADLRSNLVLALLERAVGRAYEWLRRYRQQSKDAVEVLCAVIDGALLP